MFQVTPLNGYYIVRNQLTLKSDYVTRQKNCTCGGSRAAPCVHIVAVAQYLQNGGQRATGWPTAAPLSKPPSPATTPATLPAACPLCGAPVEPRPYGWRCQKAAGHYWAWRGEQFGVRKFLTQPHPAKAGAFYEQSEMERTAFLANAQQRMRALYQGGTPYS